MNPSLRPAALVLLALGVTAPAAFAQTPPGFREQWLLQFNTAAEKFMALADAMPAEKYTWSPGEGVMPVAQVYMHVARYNYGYPAENLGVAPPEGVDMETMEQEHDKATVTAALRASFDHAREVAQAMTDEDLSRTVTLYGDQVPAWAVLLQQLTHMSEHLGQSIAYARMNEIVPPWSR